MRRLSVGRAPPTLTQNYLWGVMRLGGMTGSNLPTILGIRNDELRRVGEGYIRQLVCLNELIGKTSTDKVINLDLERPEKSRRPKA
jgi:hypothetical protein